MPNIVVRDVRLGRLALPTITDDVAESVGDTLESVGGGVVPGERRARPIQLSLPLHGNQEEQDPFVAGERMRRQMRALMENTRAKLNALYFQFAADPELNAWLIIGGGELGYGDSGLTFADFRLQLQDAFKIGSRRTHRAARRVELYDRRLSTTARDLLGTVFSSDYSGLTALALTYLPVGVTDVTGYGKRVVSYGVRPSLGGNIAVVQGASHGEVLAFEWPEASIHQNDDVVLYDRRGQSATSPLSSASRILQDAPILFLRLGEAAGATTAADASDSNLPGTYIGAAQLGYTPVGIADPDTAAGLSGRDGIYVRVLDAAPISITGDLSVEGWLLPLAGTVNHVGNPSFESDTWGWVADQSPTTFARQTGWADDGTASLRITRTSTPNNGTVGAHTAVRPNDDQGDSIRVIVGHTYTARMVANVVSAIAGNCTLLMRFYDATGVQVGTDATATASGSTAGVKVLTVTAVAPASAVYASVWASLSNTSGSAATLDFYLDSVTFVEGSTALLPQQTRQRYDVLASKWRSAANGRSYRFAYDWYAQAYVVELSTTGTNASILRYTLASALVAGQWQHVAAVYNHTAASITFYRNGVIVGTITGVATSIYDSATSLTIGKWEAD